MHVMQVQERTVLVETVPNAATIWLGVSDEEADLIDSAIQTVLAEIEREEFRTRLGVTPAAARAFRARLAKSEAHMADSRTAVPPSERAVATPSMTSVAASVDELRLINNALNEALNGLGADEVPLHLQSAEARALLDAVHAIHDETAAVASTSARPGHPDVDHIR